MGIQIRAIVAELLLEYQDTRRSLFREAAEEIVRLQSLVDPMRIDEAIPLIVSINTIVKITAETYRVTLAQLKGKTRNPKHLKARMTAVLLCRRMTRASYPTIAEQFKKSHSGMIYLERMAIKQEAMDNDYAELIGHIASKCHKYTQEHPMETTL